MDLHETPLTSENTGISGDIGGVEAVDELPDDERSSRVNRL